MMPPTKAVTVKKDLEGVLMSLIERGSQTTRTSQHGTHREMYGQLRSMVPSMCRLRWAMSTMQRSTRSYQKSAPIPQR